MVAEEDWRWDLNPGRQPLGVFLGPCSLGREPQTSISFSETRDPGLGRGGRKDCAFVGILKDFRISANTLLLLLSMYNSLNK